MKLPKNMILFNVISVLLLAINGICQTTESQNITNHESNKESGQVVDNANHTRYDTKSVPSKFIDNDNTSLIRKDTQSENITFGRNDGNHTTLTTYKNKGSRRRRPHPPNFSIGSIRVPTINELRNRNIYLTSHTPYKVIESEQVDHRKLRPETTDGEIELQACAGETVVGKPVTEINSESLCKPRHGYPHQRCRNSEAIPVTENEANPGIGGQPVPKETGFKSDPTMNEELVSKEGTSTRTLSTSPDGEATENETKLSWQVSVYRKVSPDDRVCGGSLVTSTAVITAAAPLAAVGLQADQFGVVAESSDKTLIQKNFVRDIKIPPRYLGGRSNNQEDIALLLMTKPFSLQLRPICVSFDPELDEEQLRDGSLGTILTKSKPPSVMLNLRIPVISIEQCLQESGYMDRPYVTSDKICAGVQYTHPNGSTCSIDKGSGLAFFLGQEDSVPYLRGIASTTLSPTHSNTCFNTYTHIQSHRAFLLKHVPGIERECSKHYKDMRDRKKYQVDMVVNEDKSQSVDDETESDGQFVCNCYC